MPDVKRQVARKPKAGCLQVLYLYLAEVGRKYWHGWDTGGSCCLHRTPAHRPKAQRLNAVLVSFSLPSRICVTWFSSFLVRHSTFYDIVSLISALTADKSITVSLICLIIKGNKLSLFVNNSFFFMLMFLCLRCACRCQMPLSSEWRYLLHLYNWS